MHPVLWSCGSFRLPTYGLLLAVGLGLGIWTASRLGRRKGLESGRLLDFSTWMIITGLLGAKVLMIVSNADYYFRNPGQIFSWGTLQAGGTFYGGFFAALSFAVYYIRVNRMPMGKTLDVYAPALALGHAVGRLGCFAAGCDYGKPTQSFLGVIYSDPVSHDLVGVPLGLPLHPTQLYEAAGNLIIFLGLLLAHRGKTRDGAIFLWYLLSYGALRFTVEMFRGDPGRGSYFGDLLSLPQLMSIAAVMTAIIFMTYSRGRAADPVGRSTA